jgi:hypothetical protein
VFPVKYEHHGHKTVTRVVYEGIAKSIQTRKQETPFSLISKEAIPTDRSQLVGEI